MGSEYLMLLRPSGTRSAVGRAAGWTVLVSCSVRFLGRSSTSPRGGLAPSVLLPKAVSPLRLRLAGAPAPEA